MLVPTIIFFFFQGLIKPGLHCFQNFLKFVSAIGIAIGIAIAIGIGIGVGIAIGIAIAIGIGMTGSFVE